MKNDIEAENQTKGRTRPILYTVAVAAAFAVAVPRPAYARDEIIVPSVPFNLVVDATANVPFLVGHAFGSQNYVCLPASNAAGVAFTLFTPEATLLDDEGEQIITHFFAPNPDEPIAPNSNPALNAIGLIRAAWQDSHDGSTVWAAVLNGAASTDETFVEKGAVAWLKLTKVGDERGTTGGDRLTKTTFIQRLNTHGGVAPSTGCTSPADIGHLAFMPYTADYFFYKKR